MKLPSPMLIVQHICVHSTIQLMVYCFVFFFFKQKTAYEIQYGLVGSEMCIRDRPQTNILYHCSARFLQVLRAKPEPDYCARQLPGTIAFGSDKMPIFEKFPPVTTATCHQVSDVIPIQETYMAITSQSPQVRICPASLAAATSSPVSYTHLTLPTTDLVQISVDAET